MSANEEQAQLDPIFNTHIGVPDNHGRLAPDRELAQYFLAYRIDDVVRAFDSLSFDIDFSENEILEDILFANPDNFRTIIRDGLVFAIVKSTMALSTVAAWDIVSFSYTPNPYDAYFHSSIIPNMECSYCNKKSPSSYMQMNTKYPDSYTI
jgi:hypothetical protein